MNKIYAYLLSTILSFCLSHSAYATKFITCSNLYKGVDILFLNVEGDVPNILPTTWGDTADRIKGKNLKFAQDAGLDIQTTHLSAKEIFKNHPNALYMKMVYSYAPKASFSMPLDDDVLAMWIEIERSPSIDNIQPFVRGRPKLGFFDSIGQSRPVFYSAAVGGFPENVACAILSYNKGKSCTNTEDFSKNKLIDKPNSCVNSSN